MQSFPENPCHCYEAASRNSSLDSRGCQQYLSFIQSGFTVGLLLLLVVVRLCGILLQVWQVSLSSPPKQCSIPPHLSTGCPMTTLICPGILEFLLLTFDGGGVALRWVLLKHKASVAILLGLIVPSLLLALTGRQLREGAGTYGNAAAWNTCRLIAPPAWVLLREEGPTTSQFFWGSTGAGSCICLQWRPLLLPAIHGHWEERLVPGQWCFRGRS